MTDDVKVFAVLAPLLDSPVYLEDEETKIRIYPIAAVEVKVEAHRLDEGYAPIIKVHVFPVTSPFMMLCMYRRGVHFHVPCSCSDVEVVGEAVSRIIGTEEQASDMLEHFIKMEIDTMSEADMRMGFEVMKPGPGGGLH